MKEVIKRCELLAPCGSLDIVYAAINAGCDAIYISGKDYGARSFALNFSLEEIEQAVNYAHKHLVKVYVTVNTIIFEDEFSNLHHYLASLVMLKVDAVIVQDLGVIKYIKDHFPTLEVHASTQINVIGYQGVKYLKDLGVSRVVLARETSIDTIKSLTKLGIEIEVFIHGALCFSSSGNCLLSSYIGRRSGNRGKCAQPCRKNYQLLEDNHVIDENYKPYLSMKDLMTIDYLRELIKCGVSSFKIEGRMKSAEYVHTVVSMYRKKLDDASFNLSKDDLDDILVSFNRKFTKGYLFNEQNKDLVNLEAVNHQGIKCGEVVKRTNDFIMIKLCKQINLNDGLRINALNPFGIFLTEMYKGQTRVNEGNINDVITIKISNKCQVGDQVLKTSSSKLKNQVKEAMRYETYQTPLDLTLYAYVGSEICLEARTKYNEYAKVTGNILTFNQDSHYIGEVRIKEQLGKLKNTPYILNNLTIYSDESSFISVKMLNELRRSLIDKLIEERLNYLKRDAPSSIYHQILNKRQNNFITYVVLPEKYQSLKDKYPMFTYLTEEEYGSRITINQSKVCHNLENLSLETLIISPYCNITNNEAIKTYAMLTKADIFLSLEMSKQQIMMLKDSFKAFNCGVLIYGKTDLMVSRHCIVGKYHQASNKKCMACLDHTYQIKDEYQNIYPLYLEKDFDCTMRILANQPTNIISKVEQLKSFGLNRFLVIFTDETITQVENILNKLNNYSSSDDYYSKYYDHKID